MRGRAVEIEGDRARDLGPSLRDLLADRHEAPDADWFELAVVQHTDCGRGLDDEALRRGFTERGFDDGDLDSLAVFDPTQTVPEDVDKLVNAPQVSSKIRVSGYAYDVNTGLLKTVVPPRSRDAQ